MVKKKYTKAEENKIDEVCKALDPPVPVRYEDNFADEHFRNLARLYYEEEVLILLGIDVGKQTV
jgi:hypothetical protein